MRKVGERERIATSLLGRDHDWKLVLSVAKRTTVIFICFGSKTIRWVVQEWVLFFFITYFSHVHASQGFGALHADNEYGTKVGHWNSDIFEAQWMEILSAKNSGCPHGVWGKGGREGFWILFYINWYVHKRLWGSLDVHLLLSIWLSSNVVIPISPSLWNAIYLFVLGIVVIHLLTWL